MQGSSAPETGPSNATSTAARTPQNPTVHRVGRPSLVISESVPEVAERRAQTLLRLGRGAYLHVAVGGTLTEFPLPAFRALGGITAGHDGNVYFSEEATEAVGGTGTTNAIGCIVPSTGAYREYAVPTPDAGISAEMQVDWITAGADGNLWFSLFEGDGMGRFDPTDQSVALFPLPVGQPTTGLVSAAGPSLWFAGGVPAVVLLSCREPRYPRRGAFVHSSSARQVLSARAWGGCAPEGGG
jgi:hypothetical protein